VTSARDGEAALEAIQLLLPDILLADLAMPAKDGFRLIDQLRGLPAQSGGLIPAVAISAMAAPADIQRAKALGYTAHVPKPTNPADLATLIVDLVPRRPTLKS
jgi:CheY-like chemotaxis protein